MAISQATRQKSGASVTFIVISTSVLSSAL